LIQANGHGTDHLPQLRCVDPWFGPLREAVQRKNYDVVVQAYGQRIPAPDNSFASALSNSVLEHIPDVQPVLNDLARVLKPGGSFYFCVPNHNFDPNLSIARFFERVGLKRWAAAYRRWFDRIARHVHLDDPTTWQARVEQAGMQVVHRWNYFRRGRSTLEVIFLRAVPRKTIFNR
jgi:ubiquinone/menaquinone biosynthesis C-methylase UbiE